MKKFILLALTFSASLAAAQTGTDNLVSSPALPTPQPVMLRAELRTPESSGCHLTLLKSEQDYLSINASVRQGGLRVLEGDRVNVVLECGRGKALRVLTAKGRVMNVIVSGTPNTLDWDAYFGSVPGLSVR